MITNLSRLKSQFIVWVVLLIGVKATYAQYDSAYVKPYDDRFYIKPVFSVKSAAVELKAKGDSNFETVKYTPNGNSYYGLGVYLFGVNLELSTQFPKSWQRSSENYGTTESFDFQTNVYTRMLGVDFTYQIYKGFYLNNPKNHDTNWQQGDPHFQRGDLSYENLYFNVYYVFNHKRFSFRSAYNQSEQQLKRAGSPIAMFSFVDAKIKADSAMFPDQSNVPASIQGFQYSDFITYALLGGYSYNFLFKNFYANTTLSLGPGIQSREIRPDFVEEHVIISFVTNLRLALGYNSDFFFAGMTYVNQFTGSDLELVELNVGSSRFKLFVGLRFKERGFLNRQLF